MNSTADRKPVAASIVPAVRRVPGVAYVFGSVTGYAQFMARDGNAIGHGGSSTLGFSFDPNPQLSPYRLVAGRAPGGPDDVVMDKATATKHHFAVGDRVLVNLPDRPQTFTISGLVTFGSDDNLAGVTLAGFDLATAQSLFDCPRLLRHDQRPGRAGRRQRPGSARDRRDAAARRRGGQRPDRRERALDRGQQRALVPLDCAVDLRADLAVRRAGSRSSTRSRSPSGSGPASSRCCAWSERAGGRSSARCSPRRR